MDPQLCQNRLSSTMPNYDRLFTTITIYSELSVSIPNYHHPSILARRVRNCVCWLYPAKPYCTGIFTAVVVLSTNRLITALSIPNYHHLTRTTTSTCPSCLWLQTLQTCDSQLLSLSRNLWPKDRPTDRPMEFMRPRKVIRELVASSIEDKNNLKGQSIIKLFFRLSSENTPFVS